MKKIIFTLIFLTSGLLTAQTLPTTYPAELYYGCEYQKGKDISDLMEVAAEWREWQEENDPIGRSTYNAFVWTPWFAGVEYNKPNSHMWIGISDNFENFIASQENWITKGDKINEKFNRVSGAANCAGHMLGIGVFNRQSESAWEASSLRPVLVSQCKNKEGATVMDYAAAYNKMNAYYDAAGFKNSTNIFTIFPVAGQTAEYDFLNLFITKDMETLGKFGDMQTKGGAAMQQSLFEDLMECSDSSMILSAGVPGNNNQMFDE